MLRIYVDYESKYKTIFRRTTNFLPLSKLILPIFTRDLENFASLRAFNIKFLYTKQFSTVIQFKTKILLDLAGFQRCLT